MARFDDQLCQIQRDVARLTGSQARASAFAKNLRAKVSQAAASNEDLIIKHVVKNGHAGWVNDPDRSDAVLVQAKTGGVLMNSKGQVVRGPQSDAPANAKH